jgi:hypothetical protein
MACTAECRIEARNGSPAGRNQGRLEATCLTRHGHLTGSGHGPPGFLDRSRPGMLSGISIIDGNRRFGRESGSPGFRDPNANDIHSLAARLDGLSLCSCESGTDDAGEHFERESVRA